MSSPGENLNQLAARAAGGEEEAFGLLANRISPRVHRLAWRILADGHLAADGVQEFLIKLVGALPGYDPSRSFWPWAQRMAARVAVDILRREKSWLKVPLELAPVITAQAGDRPDRQLESRQELQRLREATHELSGRQRTIFVLRDLEEWTTAEIAAHLDMAESTVRVHLARARAHLRKALNDPDKTGGHS